MKNLPENTSPSPACDLSIVIPALREAENLALLLPQIHAALAPLAIGYEILVVDEAADAATRQVVNENGGQLLAPPTHGYGKALLAGFEKAQGHFVVSMDADLSHPPKFLLDLWAARHSAEVIIASRYVPGGKADMPASRLLLSQVLNVFFSRGLALGVQDMSSGYRLYHARAVTTADITSQDFNILQELLVKALMQGYRIAEIPFDYRPRRHGSTHARVIQFGIAYLKTFTRLWRLRNSISSADYDQRAHDTLLPPQRYWQRQRYKHITQLIQGQGRCLDVGCGSSQIIGALPANSVALDIQANKLRFARRYERPLVQGSALQLPIANQSFPCVICSQVIEHIERGSVLNELDRALAPGGLLVLGTPDYSKWQWNLIEAIYKIVLPQAYADEHITHYTYQELVTEFVQHRHYQLEQVRYILQGELILGLRKPGKRAQ